MKVLWILYIISCPNCEWEVVNTYKTDLFCQFDCISDKWEEMLSSVDAIVVATKWEEYKKLSSSDYQYILAGKIILDARRCFKPTDYPKSIYLTIGRSIE